MIKKILLGMVVIVVGVLVSLAVTKPDRMAHYDAVKGLMVKVIEKKVASLDIDESFKTMGTLAALNAGDAYLRQNLLVYEHTFYNTGILIYEDNFIMVSIGAWGHAFLTFTEEDIDKYLSDKLKIIEDFI